MSDGPVVVDGIDYGHRLPRGRHGIPRELVVANQRERLLDATAAVFAEFGYASLGVASVTERAGVSRATFYKLFGDKLDCVLAAHEAAFERIRGLILEACGSAGSWPEGVAAAVAAALRFGAESPNELRLVLLSSHTVSEPQLARRGRAVHEELAELLRAGREEGPEGTARSRLVDQATIGAAMSVVAARVTAGEAKRLPELTEDLTRLILDPYLGDAMAKRIATSAGEPIR
jgi:AcrR family transcriptional regulator